MGLVHPLTKQSPRQASLKRFGFDYAGNTYTIECEPSTAVIKNFKDESGKTVARTYRAMKRVLGIKDESFLANEFRQMAMFASNYLQNQ
jgi:hypothetical protein